MKFTRNVSYGFIDAEGLLRTREFKAGDAVPKDLEKHFEEYPDGTDQDEPEVVEPDEDEDDELEGEDDDEPEVTPVRPVTKPEPPKKVTGKK
jgi:hypothetical protein